MAIQDKFNRANVIYKITKDIDLGGGTLTIPKGCTLDFQGGSFANGTIVGNDTQINALSSDYIFKNIVANGTYNSACYVEWFGATKYQEDADSPVYCDTQIQKALDSGFREVRFNIGIYYIGHTLVLSSVKHLVLVGGTTTSLASYYDIKYDKPIVDSTIISTKLDIDLLHVAITKYRNSEYDNRVSLFIEGGCFDVSNITYNSTVIKFIGKDCTIWNHKINTIIYGPLLKGGNLDDIDINAQGIGIEYTEEQSSTGHFYISTIDSDIRGFSCGIKNSMLKGSNITSFDIKGLIDGCVTHIDMGVGIQFSRITSTIQTRRYFTNNDKTYCIIGKLNQVYVDAIFWDLNLGDESKKSNRYAFIIDKADTVTVGKNCENLLLNYVDGYIYGAYKDFNDNTILTKGVQLYGRNRKSYFGLLDNVFLHHRDYSYETSGTITSEDIPWGNPFAVKGLCIQPKKDISGSNIKFTITNIPNKAVTRFIVSVPMLIEERKYSFSEIVITSKYNNNVVKSQTFDNSSTPSLYAQPFFAIFSNDLFSIDTDTIEVEFKNFQMSDSDINKQLYITFEGSTTYNDYKQICTREYAEIAPGGTFKLHGNSLSYVGGNTPYLRNNESKAIIYSTAYMPTYYDAQVIMDLINANPDAYGEGARFNLYSGNQYRLVVYSKRFNTLFSTDGYTYFGVRRGSENSRPALTEKDTGFLWYDDTIARPLFWTGTRWYDFGTGSGGAISYNDVLNKPKIGDVELSGTKTLVQLGIQPAGDYATETYVTEQIAAVVGNINSVLDTINGEVI